MRMRRGVAQIAGILQAHVQSQALPQPSLRSDVPLPERDSASGDSALDSVFRTVAPAHSTPPAALPASALDIELLLQEIADRLEWEFTRAYGTAGG
jgi:hypothetical protein